MTHLLRRALIPISILLASCVAGCAGAAGCGGTSLPGGLPVSEERLGALQMRLTQNGLDWLGDNIQEIVTRFVPGGLSFNIPESSQLGGLVVICPASQHPQGCPFQVEINQAVLVAHPPSGIVADLFLDIPRQEIPMRAFGSNCAVTVDAERTPVQLWVNFEPDPVTRALSVVATVQPLSGDNLNIGGTGICATVQLMRGFLLGQMQGEIQTRLNETLEDQTCLRCPEGCPPQTTCGARELCRHGSGRCVAKRQGVAGQMDLAPLIGAVATQPSSILRYGVSAGGNVAADAAGLSLGAMGGAGAEASACVPSVPERERSPVSAPTFPTTAPDGQTYALGLAISREFVEDLAAAFWRSGAFCLRATSRSVAQLTSDAFALAIPALSKLTDGKTRPVILGIRLDSEPRVSIGRGTSHVDSRGQRVLDDPLIALRLLGLTLDLFTLVEDRMTHIGTVRQDVTVPLGLDLTPDNKVEILLGDLTQGITNVQVSDAEILGETAPSLGQSVPLLIALALPFALQSLEPFEIPSFSGFAITPRGIQGEGPPGGLTHAVIYADLKLVPVTQPPMRAVASTSLRILQVRPGEVLVAFSGVSPTGDPLEWSWRLDEGLWSPYTPADRVRINDPRLWLLGEHRLEVRARAQGHPATLDPSPATTAFQIEPAPAAPGGQVPRGCELTGGGGLSAALALCLWLAWRRRRGLSR
jgi:hypothetical protein